MSQEIYPFHKNENGTITPKIPIRITNQKSGERIHAYALLDTGAENCNLPIMIARTIGLQYTDGYKSKVGSSGISGEIINTWIHVVKIELLDVTRKEVIKTVTSRVSCLNTNDIPAIVGTKGFLENLRVTLDYVKKEIIIDC